VSGDEPLINLLKNGQQLGFSALNAGNAQLSKNRADVSSMKSVNLFFKNLQ